MKPIGMIYRSESALVLAPTGHLPDVIELLTLPERIAALDHIIHTTNDEDLAHQLSQVRRILATLEAYGKL